MERCSEPYGAWVLTSILRTHKEAGKASIKRTHTSAKNAYMQMEYACRIAHKLVTHPSAEI